MALPFRSTTDTTEHAGRSGAGTVGTLHRLPTPVPRGRRRVGIASLAVSLAASIAWLAWRIATVPLHPLPIAVVALEVLGVAAGTLVALQFARSATVAPDAVRERDPARRYALAVADVTGRRAADDLHPAVRDVVRAARRTVRRRSAEYAVAGVVIDGPRRLGLVVGTVACLLLGVAPSPWPPLAAALAAAVGLAAMSLAHVLLSGGRVRPGDRVRWTYSSLGEAIVRDDVDGVAPRYWVGTVATIVLVSIAIALRGMSDRWTHGLPHMHDTERVAAMVYALCFVLGALFTLATTAPPELDNAHLVARRLEERTARQSLLGATVCVGLIGLVAGILPGSVDPADDDARRIEHVVDDDAVDPQPVDVPPVDLGAGLADG